MLERTTAEIWKKLFHGEKPYPIEDLGQQLAREHFIPVGHYLFLVLYLIVGLRKIKLTISDCMSKR
jgi:hypothetical protein